MMREGSERSRAVRMVTEILTDMWRSTLMVMDGLATSLYNASVGRRFKRKYLIINPRKWAQTPGEPETMVIDGRQHRIKRVDDTEFRKRRG